MNKNTNLIKISKIIFIIRNTTDAAADELAVVVVSVQVIQVVSVVAIVVVESWVRAKTNVECNRPSDKVLRLRGCCAVFPGSSPA